MGHVKIIVDHERIEYDGPFDASDMFRHVQNFLFERGFDTRQDKDFEHHTPSGTEIEWQISPWKRITDYARHMIKIRVLIHDMKKISVSKEGKKTKIDNGKIQITIDGFIESDYESKWEEMPMFMFLRTIYDKFIFKIYTERFEQRLTHDINQLSHSIGQFLNVYRSYSVVSRPATEK